MKLLLIFIILNVVNVIIQTIKSIATVKCGRVPASLINAFAYGLYTVVLVYMNCDLELWQKVLVVGGANLIGVYVVKFFEEKKQKEMLWKIEVTTNPNTAFLKELNNRNLSFNTYEIDREHFGVNIYCYSKKETSMVKEILKSYDCKYFVSESKGQLF